MPIPKHEDLVNPLLQAMHALGGKATEVEQQASVAKALELSPQDIAEIYRGTHTKLSYRLVSARNSLKRLGLIDLSGPAKWRLTEAGLARKLVADRELRLLTDEPPDIDVGSLDLGHSEDFGEYPIDSVLVRQETRSVFEIVRRIRDDKFILDPDFQRDFIWPLDKQSKLIESTLLRIPLPVLYLAERDDGKTVVVDGLQRLTTFKRYLADEFELTGLDIGKDLNGDKFSSLPAKLQNRIEDAQLILYLIDPKVPEQARLDIFERVNGGIPLSRQQMRNCIYAGGATRWLKTEADQIQFLEATGRSLSRATMRDRECINRYCAFELLTAAKYERGDIDTFLANALRSMNEMSAPDMRSLSDRFRQSMRNNYLLFGRHAFRKHRSPFDRRSLINVALFDVMSVILSDYPDSHVADRREPIQAAFYALMADKSFSDAISFSTNSSKKVVTRFERGRDFLLPALGHVDKAKTRTL